jgi:uncharacterized protein YhaN
MAEESGREGETARCAGVAALARTLSARLAAANARAEARVSALQESVSRAIDTARASPEDAPEALAEVLGRSQFQDVLRQELEQLGGALEGMARLLEDLDAVEDVAAAARALVPREDLDGAAGPGLTVELF